MDRLEHCVNSVRQVCSRAQCTRQNFACRAAVAVRSDGAAGCATLECLGRALPVKEQAFVARARREALARNEHAVPRRCAVRNQPVTVRLFKM